MCQAFVTRDVRRRIDWRGRQGITGCVAVKYVAMHQSDIAAAPPLGVPPPRLFAFYRYFLREHRTVLIWLFVCGFGVACADALVSVFVGKVVAFVGQGDRWKAWHENWPTLLGFLLAIGIARPLLIYVDLRLRNDHLVPGVTSRIRWI